MINWYTYVHTSLLSSIYSIIGFLLHFSPFSPSNIETVFSLIISFETSLDKLLIFDLFTLFKVRKSREKKKQREQETEKRVKELSDENGALQNKLDIALKEMNLLKNLYKNIGVQLPADVRDKLENELSKFK